MHLRKLAIRSQSRWQRLINPHAFERTLIERRYQTVFGRLPDLDHPRLFTEKLIWLNLHYRNPLLRTFVDKYESRLFVERTFGNADLLLPLLGTYYHPGEINFDRLPDRFVLKVTSGCNWNLFCLDKSKLDLDQARRQLSAWMSDSYFDKYREWPYRGLRPRILAEPFMTEPGHPDRSPPDFKFWCFDGRPRFVSICTDRRGDRRMDLYDCDRFAPLPFNFGAGKRRDEPHSRPDDFDRMISICQTLARGLPFVRVDLYQHQRQVIFGELTVYPFAGFVPLNPPSFDAQLGDWLTLPTDHLVATRRVRAHAA